MDNYKLAQFIFGMVDMSVASELPEAEQIQSIKEDLDSIKGTNLYYYLCSACENRQKKRRNQL